MLASPNRLRARSPPNVPKGRVQKAKEVLKKAIKTGRLQEILWGRDGVGKKVKRGTRQSQRVNQAFLDELKQSLQDSMDMDDIAIWNQVLMQRMAHGKMIFHDEDNRPTTTEMEAMAEDEEEDEEEDEAGSEKDDHVADLPHDTNQTNEDGGIIERKKSVKTKKKKVKKVEVKKGKPRKQSVAAPESENVAFRLAQFDTLPVLDMKDKYYVGTVRKPKRVSQIIKDIKTFQQKINASNNNADAASANGISEAENESDDETNSISTTDDQFSVTSGDFEVSDFL